MNMLFASDAFKGSLTSAQTAALLAQAAQEVFGDIAYTSLPMADGGEGTAEAVLAAQGGTWVEAAVHDPLMRPLVARYGKLDGQRAIIEMAAASGLPLVPSPLRNPLLTTTYGTGELIRHALAQGFREIAVAIGGSATNDGGMGCVRALGARFLDSAGRALAGRGEDLARVAAIDLSGLDPRLKSTRLTVMCDVKNPLCGERGATYTYSAQKGATPAMQAQLEAGMVHYREVIRRDLGVDPDTLPGAGAAGGLGAALAVFCGGEMQSGIETVLELMDFDSRLEGVDLVVTGEGRTDGQSCNGKVLSGIGEHAKRKGVLAVALSGSLGEGAEAVYDHGIEALMTAVDGPMGLDEAMERAEAYYKRAAVRMFRFLRGGRSLPR